MSRLKIVFADYYYPDNRKEREILERLEGVEILDLTKRKQGGIKDPEELLPHVVDADALIVQFADVNARLIRAMERCRIVARYAIGVDNIDLDAAREKGIVVSNVPDYCVEEVSDTAVAHIFNCMRGVSLSNALLHEGRWDYDKIKPLKRMAECTVGLVAFGHIARRTAEKLRPLGVSILASDPFFSPRDDFGWVEFVSPEELYRRSDIVSVHAPLNRKTKNMIGEEAFSSMKEGVCLVNTSRGGLIDEAALIKAIETGKVRSAGLDVLDLPDPRYGESPLLKYPDRITISPHLGWYSEASIRELQEKVAMNVFMMLTQGEPLYRVP